MNVSNLRDRIATYINSKSKRGEISSYDQDIFSAGLVNSMFALQLIRFLETEFGVEVRNDQLILKNLKSVDALAELVKGLLLEKGTDTLK